MCIAIPAQVVEIEGEKGIVNLGGVTKEIMLSFTPEAKVGDWVLMHTGFALNIISEERETLYSRMIRKSIEIFDKYPEDFHEGRKELIKHWHRIRRRELVRKEKQLSERRVKFLNRIISGVPVLPNAGIIVLSLLYGAKDKADPLGRSVCISAMMGLDTDCNCGNVGAILGAQLGADKIPKKWVEPLKNTFNTYIKGYEHWKIDELAERVVNIGKQVIIKRCSNVIKLKE